jgi:hypothetical protein
MASVGIKSLDGFILVASGDDGKDCVDVCAAMHENLPTGSPVLCVPVGLMMTSTDARCEIGDDVA